jgi:hypothetical protein
MINHLCLSIPLVWEPDDSTPGHSFAAPAAPPAAPAAPAPGHQSKRLQGRDRADLTASQ